MWRWSNLLLWVAALATPALAPLTAWAETCGEAVVELIAASEGTGDWLRAREILAAAMGLGAIDPPLALKDETVEALPILSIDPPVPMGGQTATVTVVAEGASSIGLGALGDGCGGFDSHFVSGDTLAETQIVGGFGFCDLTATVNQEGGFETYRTRFTVEPVALELPPIEVIGGVFVPGEMPPISFASGVPIIWWIEAPETIINGATVELRAHLFNEDLIPGIEKVHVQVPGSGAFAGYYEAPAILDTVERVIVARIRLDEEFGAGASREKEARQAAQGYVDKGAVDIIMQLADAAGRFGNQKKYTVTTQTVGSGEVQVSLSWNTLTDLDLHVVEPSGEEIWFGNRTSASGGELDLDSNAFCSLDGINHENVAWLPDLAPTGEYIVRVNFWSDCGGKSADWVVTTFVCGRFQTVSGRFEASTATPGGEGAGTEVARITTEGCDARVRGRALYEDFAQKSDGLATTSTDLPIRFAEVQVVHDETREVLATGATGQDGSFDLRFSNAGTPGYFVRVWAEQTNETVRQRVVDKNNDTYTVRSAGTIDETQMPDLVNLEIRATRTTGAAAFNIFDMGAVGSSLIRSAGATTPPHVTWVWTDGDRGVCGPPVSCYSPMLSRISVLSVPEDRDEYDDLVLLKQYGFHWLESYADWDSPGGLHAVAWQVDPRLAWAEGATTFFACLAKKTPFYVDTNAAGLRSRQNIEFQSDEIPLGTATGTMSGDVSEAVVSAILWDLADWSDESRDTLSRPGGVFTAASYLKSPGRSDRGRAGADLVDFLDGWFCKGLDERGDNASGVQGIVMGLQLFPYDFAPPEGCEP